MTAFLTGKLYYELTLYFDAWNKEIVGYGLSSKKGDVKTYYDGLNQVLELIKKEQIEDLIILHTDQGLVYSVKAYNKLLENYNNERPSYALNYKTPIQYKIELGF